MERKINNISLLAVGLILLPHNTSEYHIWGRRHPTTTYEPNLYQSRSDPNLRRYCNPKKIRVRFNFAKFAYWGGYAKLKSREN